ncbi:transglycosylase SLT domain-containing protein [Actibacterium lipolyticum]|uniref:Transglycosylase SLT domain protein n=1 Tax=Actibacterium lipolyticum TaxID=1524263 RepID=A0A238KYW2_9RHOB|nr:transglycosylase SLT domain-containing protein [Actibacterium lipolyticum]SMX47392.1 Transglycosylase SLT domain protein [Actibacterium lipolyticum]
MARFSSQLKGIVIWIATIGATQSLADPSVLCDHAAQKASEAMGVPISVLKAISLTETGRKRGGEMRPWPWTVNMEGKGVWFDDPDSAKAYVYKHYKTGARSFDVGCFQLNYRWHGQNFSSIDEMFQPEPNALYAAQFLSDLYKEMGNWSAAAGAYHSRTKKYATRYRKRFDVFRAAFIHQDGTTPAPVPAAPPSAPTSAPAPVQVATRINKFPLLKTGQGARGLGSLVPITTTPSAGLFIRPQAGG